MASLCLVHLDADCFYVSAERVRYPFLLGKPTAVLGNQGACVIAKSYEMKAAGVKTGEPIWQAKRKCPHAIYLKRDFRWYEVLSRQMLDIVREFSPTVEYYSIDEFFFTCAEPTQETAAAIRDRIGRAVGVPVTVGIGRTRTLAKLFSDTAKPLGARAVTDPEGERLLLSRLPVTEISGIAHRRAARLAPHGIHTCLDLADADRRLIRRLLGVTGLRLWWELNGTPALPLHTERPPHKMLSRGGSLGRATTDPQRAWGWAVRTLERLIEELEHHCVLPGRLAVWAGYKDGPSAVDEVRLEAPTDRFDLLLEVVRETLRRVWRPAPPLSRLHLIATDLHWPGQVQHGLFEPPAARSAALARLKREVNARCGRFTLRSGATLWVNDLYGDPANGYDICDVRGKICF